MLSDLSRSEFIVSNSIKELKAWMRHVAVFYIKYDFFQFCLFAFCTAHARNFIGFRHGELTVQLLDSVITFIAVIKFVACNIATAQET